MYLFYYTTNMCKEKFLLCSKMKIEKLNILFILWDIYFYFFFYLFQNRTWLLLIWIYNTRNAVTYNWTKKKKTISDTRSMLTSCSTKRFPNPSKGNDRSAKHPFVKRDMITCVRKRTIGFGVFFCENNGVPSKRGSVKKWETSVGPRCLSNGSTSSMRTKIECSQSATLIMIGKQ